MKLYVLSENTALDGFTFEHGLSLYFEGKDKILFDMGQGDNFLLNAKKLNVNIKDVDIAIISHGHYDHGGGIGTFLKENNKSKIYIQDSAFNDFYSLHNDGIKYIGLDKQLNDNRIVRLNGDYVINDYLEIMSNVEQKYPLPLTDKTLYLDKEGKIQDNFCHEHNLVIKDNGYILVLGCAHNGIKNILEYFKKKYKVYPNIVIGGMHLYSRTGKTESEEEVETLGKYLLTTGAKFYTGHCTGEPAYKVLKSVLKDQIEKLSTGKIFELEA